MSYLRLLVLLVCLQSHHRLMAQTRVFYPPVPELRAALLKLADAKSSAFQHLKGAALNKKGATQYYNATLHLVPSDTPRIAEDTQPLQVYYLDFLNKGLEEEQSKTVYKKWQALIAEALPEYVFSMAGKQYPDLESMDISRPGYSPKFTLYRNGAPGNWQVSVSIINSNLNELLAILGDKPVSNPAKTDGPGNPETQPAGNSGPLKTGGDKPPLKPKEDAPLSKEQTVMAQSIAKLLNARGNNFQSFRDVLIKGGKGSAPRYAVKGTEYPLTEDLVEFIEAPAGRASTYTLSLADEYEAGHVVAAFRHALSADMQAQGYKYSREVTSGTTSTYTITCKGATAAVCIFTDERGKSETTIMVYGK